LGFGRFADSGEEVVRPWPEREVEVGAILNGCPEKVGGSIGFSVRKNDGADE
jgi:hypothetical protein